jgi:hypothetical protein
MKVLVVRGKVSENSDQISHIGQHLQNDLEEYVYNTMHAIISPQHLVPVLRDLLRLVLNRSFQTDFPSSRMDFL